MDDVLPRATIRTQVPLPLRFPDGYTTMARVISFYGLVDGGEHLALGLGSWAGTGATADTAADTAVDTGADAVVDVGADAGADAGTDAPPSGAREGTVPLVRPHSECLTGDVFGSERCDCGPQLREAVERIVVAGGFLLYLRQEGRGIGLYAKLEAYALQDDGLDTYQANLALGHGADERDYTVAAQMLRALAVDRLALLSNNPDKEEQLVRHGLIVTERIPTAVHLSPTNASYLSTKAQRAGHLLETQAVR